jgi:teichuronic acid exporter
LSTLKNRTYRAFAWDFVGNIANQGIGFITSIFLARLLSPSDFGIVVMVNVFIGVSFVFIDVGLSQGLIQKKNVEEVDYYSVFWFNTLVASIISLVFFLSAGFLATFYKNELVKPVTQVLSLSIFINSLSTVLTTKLRKELKHNIKTQVSIISAAISGCLGIIMAFKGYGVWSLVFQNLLSGIITTIILYIRLKWYPKLLFNFHALKDLWNFGFRMFIISTVGVIYINLDSIIIGRISNSSTLGLYNRGKSFNELLNNYLAKSLISVLFPVFSELQNDTEKIKTVLNSLFHILIFLLFNICALLFIIGGDFINLVYSSKWAGSISYFKILIINGYEYPITWLMMSVLAGIGNSKAYLKIDILKKILLGINFIFGFAFGIKGFLYGLTLVNILGLIINVEGVSRSLSIKSNWFYKQILIYLSHTLLIALITFIISDYFKTSFLIHFIVGSSIYFILLLITSTFLSIPAWILIRSEISKYYQKFRDKSLFIGSQFN